MLVWVDRQDVVSVAATQHAVEQAAALDEGCHGEEEEAWVDGLACAHIMAISRIDT